MIRNHYRFEAGFNSLDLISSQKYGRIKIPVKADFEEKEEDYIYSSVGNYAGINRLIEVDLW